jgi:large subunit ribosomal protein L23
MKDSYSIIKTIYQTEKGGNLTPLNKYLFSVASDANKIDIKNAVEEIYKVKVKSVNTQVVSGKLKRVRYQYGRTFNWKKAIVTLKEGHKIEVA